MKRFIIITVLAIIGYVSFNFFNGETPQERLDNAIEVFESTQSLYEAARVNLLEAKLEVAEDCIKELKKQPHSDEREAKFQECKYGKDGVVEVSKRLGIEFPPRYDMPYDLFYTFLKEDNVYVSQTYDQHVANNGFKAVDVATSGRSLTQYAPDLYNQEVEWKVKHCNWSYTAGKCIELIREGDHKVMIGHVKEYLVDDGSIVKTGDPIIITGGDKEDEGISTGLHAHYEYFQWAELKGNWNAIEYKLGESNKHISIQEKKERQKNNPLDGWDVWSKGDKTHLDYRNDIYRYTYDAKKRDKDTPWQILSCIHLRETGRNMYQTKESSAGAKGNMQFLQSTWNHYCSDLSIGDVVDDVECADRYLYANYKSHNNNWYDAIYRYNHAHWYVNFVLECASELGFNQ